MRWTVVQPAAGVPVPAQDGLPVLMFAGQSEGDGIAEIDGKGGRVMLRDQDSLTPFVQCLCQGGVHGLVELAFHASTVGCGEGHREVNSGFHVDLTFKYGDCKCGSKVPQTGS